MLIIESCIMVMNFESELGIKIADYEDVLRSIGIEGDQRQIIGQIKQRRMKYKLMKLNKGKEANNNAKSDFYELLAMASERLGYHIPSDILLVEWCGILNIIKKMSDGRRNKES